MTPSEVIESFRQRCNDSRTYHDTAVAGWNKVCDAIQNHALAMRPKPKVFEVHHMSEVARLAYAESMLAGHAWDKAVSTALNRIGITLS